MELESALPIWMFCPVIELFFAAATKALAQSSRLVWYILSMAYSGGQDKADLFLE